MTDLDTGSRAIRQLSVYLEELKADARAMAESGTAEQRGYFTPSEDERIRWLLNGYWQSRNALFDLVLALRRDMETTDAEQRPVGFLIGFCGALMLVDAARFLRELAEDRPHLKAKLNEPAPEFGIPSGVYDRVQESLLSARHAWHLYHAFRYHETHRDALRRAAEDGRVGDLFDRSLELLPRVHVPVARFLESRWKTRGGLLARRVTSDLFQAAMYGLQKLGGVLVADKYLRRNHVPQLPPRIVDGLRLRLEPGDVLIVRKEFALTNYFLPGYWPHVALFLGTADRLRALGLEDFLTENARPAWRRLLENDPLRPDGTVFESMKDGVLLRPLASPMRCDSVVVLRPLLAPEDIGRSIARGLVHEGKPYDFDFDFRRSDRLVCSEVVYRSYDGIGGAEFPLVRRAGRMTLSGSDLIRMSLDGRALRPVAVYAPRISGRDALLVDADVPAVLRKAEAIPA